MGRYGWGLTLLLILSLGGVAGLFIVQNSTRTTQLSLDLGMAAWQLEQPVSVPLLMGACLVAGLLLGAVPVSLRSYSRGRRVKQLERELALQDTRSERPW